MRTTPKLTYLAVIALMSCLVVLINGCFGSSEEPETIPPGPSGSTSTTQPIIYKKVPNVVGFPLSSAKIKLADTGFTPTVPGIYFGGGNRFVASQNPPAGTLVPKDTNIVIALGITSPAVGVVTAPTTTIPTEAAGGTTGGGTTGGGGGGGAGSTTTTTTIERFADLFIASIVTDPIEPDASEDTEILIKVSNRGNAPSEVFVLFFFEDASGDADTEASSGDASCRFPDKENRHNQSIGAGETKTFRCENAWDAPGLYNMVAQIDYDAALVSADETTTTTTLTTCVTINGVEVCTTATSDADEEATVEDQNPDNDRLEQSILVDGDFPASGDPGGTTTTTVPGGSTTTTTVSPPSSTTTSTTTTIPLIGGLSFSNYLSERLGYSVDYPTHWLKGKFNISAKTDEEYFIDTAPGLAGNSISVTAEELPVKDLTQAFTYQIQRVTEESGFPPYNTSQAQVGSNGAYMYDVLSENPGHSATQTISLVDGKVWLVTYTASDLSYDDDYKVFERFLSSFKN